MSRSDPLTLQPFVNRLSASSILTEAERNAVLALPTYMLKIRANRDFAYEDDASGYAHFIASGLVARFDQTAEGLRQITAVHIPGDMADLNSVIRPFGVGGLTALCDTTVLSIPHTAIRALAARYPAIAEALWRDCMIDAAIMMQWLVNIGRRSAQTRLAHLLCEMAVRLGRQREILMDFDLPVTQVQLGDASGLTSVHVNRSLRSLSKAGMVTAVRGSVHIHDWNRLVQIGEFNAAYLVGGKLSGVQKHLVAAE